MQKPNRTSLTLFTKNIFSSDFNWEIMGMQSIFEQVLL
jgi:hypothetical protein